MIYFVMIKYKHKEEKNEKSFNFDNVIFTLFLFKKSSIAK